LEFDILPDAAICKVWDKPEAYNIITALISPMREEEYSASYLLS
jgi:hypothetical protein